MGADTGLIEALKNLKKGMELVVKELKIKGGDFPAQTVQFRFHDPGHGKCRAAH